MERPLQTTQVHALSGEVLLTTPLQQGHTIKASKEALESICGASRFRQRLLLKGQALTDDHVPEEPAELQLVQLNYITATELQIEELVNAAADGAVATVEDILQRPQDPNDYITGHDTVGEICISALFWAALNNRTDVIRLLLCAKAALDAEGNDVALWHAAGAGNLEAVQVLLDEQANVEARHGSTTALYIAACNDRTAIVDMLLSAAADVRHWTPLHVACAKNCHGTAMLLLRKRADSSTVDYYGASPLKLAFCQGHLDIMLLIADSFHSETEQWTDRQTSHRDGQKHRAKSRSPRQ